jgi:hypothetical protein
MLMNDLEGLRAIQAAHRSTRASTSKGHALVMLLVGLSVADIATTALALSRGGNELSPGGGVMLAAMGLGGLVVMKFLAVTLVWVLRRGSPFVGRVVGWGLAVMTFSAVASNLYAVGGAALRA